MRAVGVLLVLAGVAALVVLAGTGPFGWPAVGLVALLFVIAATSGDRR